MANQTKAGNWYLRINPSDATHLDRSTDGKNWSNVGGWGGAKFLDLNGQSNGDCIIETSKGRIVRKANGNYEKK